MRTFTAIPTRVACCVCMNLLILQHMQVLVAGHDKSCRYADDGACDEPQFCASGTDCSDCGNDCGNEATSYRAIILPTPSSLRERREYPKNTQTKVHNNAPICVIQTVDALVSITESTMEAPVHRPRNPTTMGVVTYRAAVIWTAVTDHG